ncbi:MAG: hypothetical protein NTZ79_17315 [Proteobacteria bacterium]|nr:hypothetical protein [Pseudomonadota bacterium]
MMSTWPRFVSQAGDRTTALPSAKLATPPEPTLWPACSPASEFQPETAPLTPLLALPKVTAPALARGPYAHFGELTT